MGCTFFTSFLCNYSCNFQYFILGWPTLRLVLGPSISLFLSLLQRSIDSGAGTSTKPRQVGELDLSNSKSMKIRLNPGIVRKVLKRRSANQDDAKKLLLYAQ